MIFERGGKKKHLKVRSVCFGTDGSETRMKTNDVSETVEQNFVISLMHLTGHRRSAAARRCGGLCQKWDVCGRGGLHFCVPALNNC